MQPTTLVSAIIVAFSTTAMALPTGPTVIGIEVNTTLSERAPSNDVLRDVRLCTDAENVGRCITQRLKANGQCYNIVPEFDNKISFLWISDARCLLFDKRGCDDSGPSRGVAPPGVQNMALIGLNDAMSSFSCKHY